MDGAELVALSLLKADMYPCRAVVIWKTVWVGSGCVRAGTDRLIILGSSAGQCAVWVAVALHYKSLKTEHVPDISVLRDQHKN